MHYGQVCKQIIQESMQNDILTESVKLTYMGAYGTHMFALWVLNAIHSELEDFV
jgi:hypothetical protein